MRLSFRRSGFLFLLLGGSPGAWAITTSNISQFLKACFDKPLKNIVGAPQRPDGQPHTADLDAQDRTVLDWLSNARQHGAVISFRTSQNENVQGFVDSIDVPANGGSGNQTVYITTAAGEQLRVPLWSVIAGTLESKLSPKLTEEESRAYETLQQAHAFKTPVPFNDPLLGYPQVKSFGLNIMGLPTVQLQLSDGRLINVPLHTAAKLLRSISSLPSFAALLARRGGPATNANPFASSLPTPKAPFPNAKVPAEPRAAAPSRPADDPTARPPALEFRNLKINGVPTSAAVAGLNIKEQQLQSLLLRTPKGQTLTVRPEEISLPVELPLGAAPSGGDHMDLHTAHPEVIDYEELKLAAGDNLSVQSWQAAQAMPVPAPFPNSPSLPAAALRSGMAVSPVSPGRPNANRLPGLNQKNAWEEVHGRPLNPDPDDSRKGSGKPRSADAKVRRMLEEAMSKGLKLRFQAGNEIIEGYVAKLLPKQRVQMRLTGHRERIFDIAAIQPDSIAFIP